MSWRAVRAVQARHPGALVLPARDTAVTFPTLAQLRRDAGGATFTLRDVRAVSIEPNAIAAWSGAREPALLASAPGTAVERIEIGSTWAGSQPVPYLLFRLRAREERAFSFGLPGDGDPSRVAEAAAAALGLGPSAVLDLRR